MRTLKIEPLTKEAFAPFGDVIETAGSDYFMINNGSTRRYHKLATVETAQPEDNAIISIFSAEKLEMPLRIRMLERHPLGSQAFIRCSATPFWSWSRHLAMYLYRASSALPDQRKAGRQLPPRRLAPSGADDRKAG